MSGDNDNNHVETFLIIYIYEGEATPVSVHVQVVMQKLHAWILLILLRLDPAQDGRTLRDKYREEEGVQGHLMEGHKGKWRSACKMKAHKDGS